MKSNRFADQVHPTLPLPPGLQTLFYKALDVSSTKMEFIL